MKLTKHKREWVAEKIKHYCSLFEVAEPRVFLTMAEYNREKERLRKKHGYTRVGRTECIGVCHRVDKFIVILVKRNKNLAQLDETIRHELIHYAKPSYNHYSAEFKDRMKRLKEGRIRNGRFC